MTFRSPTRNAGRRPHGVTDATVAAVGKVTEALEWVERARGVLYEFHHLMGHADLTLGEAASELEKAGHPVLAEMIRNDVVGRNVISNRWTFEIVEEFDASYYPCVKAMEDRIRSDLMEGRRHVYEAEMKDREQENEE